MSIVTLLLPDGFDQSLLTLEVPAGTPIGYVPRVVDLGGGQLALQLGVIASGSGGGFVPTYIAPGETFLIPDNRQAVFGMPIINEGSIVIGANSYLIGINLP